MAISLYFYLTFTCAIFIGRTTTADDSIDYNDNEDDVDNEESFDFLLTNGFKVRTDYYHYVVSLRTAEHIAYWGDNHFCEGVIISSKTVLTAAHCVVNRKGVKMEANRVRVIAGLINRLDKPLKSHDIGVASIEVHPEYKRFEQHDIAMLRLKSPFIKTRTLHEAKIKRFNVEEGHKDFEDCIMTGWGQLYPDGPYSNALLYAEVFIVNKDDCLPVYDVFNLDFNVCVRSRSTTSDLCRGDFGAPLVCRGALVGIFGAVTNCTGNRSFLRFTNIVPYIDWIIKAKNRKNANSVVSLGLTSYVIISIILSVFI